MDNNFLELLGNLLIGTARGKKQVEDMLNWVQKGVSSSANSVYDLPSMFKTFYGLDQLSERSADYKQIAEKAVNDFHESLKEYVSMLGVMSDNELVVPKEKYLALVRKYEKLKEKYESQKESINHLRMLLGATEKDTPDLISGVQDIIKGQTEIFQKMFKGFTGLIMSKGETDNNTK